MFLACSDMWPRWIPSLDNARKAPRFWAKPTDAKTSPNSLADFTLRIFMAIRAIGWVFTAPPINPTAIGNSIEPSKSPFLFLTHFEKVVYGPLNAAYACPPASIARWSLPVAKTTAIMPFMAPLLWVAALYGSAAAKAEA